MEWIREKYVAIGADLDERGRRRWAGAEARSLGWGGIAAVAEALVFAKKSGVDPAKVRNALLGGFAQSRVLELHGQRMLDRNFTPGGKVHLHKKDTDIAVEAAKQLGIYLPGSALLAQLWNSVTAMGGSEWDHSSIVKCLEVLSNTEVTPG